MILFISITCAVSDFLSSADFFHEYHKNAKQFGSRSGPTFSVLIWVQTICKGYQQATLAGNECD